MATTLWLVYALGWAGTGIYLASYAYIGLVVDFRRDLYFGANALAAALVTVSSAALGTWQSVLINAFWLLVSIWSRQRWRIRIRWFNRFLLRGLVTAMLSGAVVFSLKDGIVAIAILGWSSVLAYCGSYLLFSARAMATDEFHLFNAYAAAALLPQLWLDSNWPVLALEICWFVLALTAFARHVHRGLGLPAELDDES